MINRIVIMLICIQTVLGVCTVHAADDASVNMVIDDGTVTREIDPEMYGVNMEWDSGPNDTWDIDESGNLVMNESFSSAYGDLFQFTRKAGSSANLFLWKKALGDLKNRESQKIWWRDAPVYEGIVEWLKCLYLATEHPRITYTVNITTDTYENMADLVEFLTGDGTVNYNGGINWAEERKKLGFEEPVDIYTWEIGNELDWNSFKFTPEQYVEAAEKAIDVIKSIDPDGKIAMFTATDQWAGADESQRWHRLFLEKCGDKIDYVAVHYYYPANFVRRADQNFDILKKDIVEITGSDRIKIYYSEQAPGPLTNTFDKDNPYPYCEPHSIWGATAQAEWYLRKWLDPWVVASTCHSTDSANWAIHYTDENKETHLTATGEVMKTFKKYGSGKMLDVKLDGFDADTSSLIAGGAIEDEDGNMNIFFLNRNESQDVTVNFDFEDYNYKIKHIRQVYGDTKTADTWYRAGAAWEYNNPDKIKIVDEDYNESSDLKSYTFKPLSLYVLQTEKTTAIDPSQKRGIFTDISDYGWAKDSIEGLYKQGIVSGTGNDLFEPERKVTREEFIKMLILAKGYSLTDNKCNFFDVNQESWYAPYINTAIENSVANGITDDSFGIGESITRQDAAVLIWRCGDNSQVEEDNSFIDNSEISDYARPAMNWMKNKGYISGYDDGTVKPKNGITRAEAAKILFSIISTAD